MPPELPGDPEISPGARAVAQRDFISGARWSGSGKIVHVLQESMREHFSHASKKACPVKSGEKGKWRPV